MRSWPGALLFIVTCHLAGVIGALTTETGSSSWYQELAKPPFQPPGWVFGPVWLTLYTLMGIAAWRIYRKGTETPGVRRALTLFAIQLVLNAVWSPVFFGAHQIVAAAVILVSLWLVLVATILAFLRLDRPAGWMLVPYLLWVSFASVLNIAIAVLN